MSVRLSDSHTAVSSDRNRAAILASRAGLTALVTPRPYSGRMKEKIDKFTAARIRHFHSTGMAVQKALPFDRSRVDLRPAMLAADTTTRPHYGSIIGVARTKTA